MGVRVLLALASIVIGTYVVGRIKDRNVVRQLEAEIRRRGEPLTLADLAQRYKPIPAEQTQPFH